MSSRRRPTTNLYKLAKTSFSRRDERELLFQQNFVEVSLKSLPSKIYFISRQGNSARNKFRLSLGPVFVQQLMSRRSQDETFLSRPDNKYSTSFRLILYICSSEYHSKSVLSAQPFFITSLCHELPM